MAPHRSVAKMSSLSPEELSSALTVTKVIMVPAPPPTGFSAAVDSVDSPLLSLTSRQLGSALKIIHVNPVINAGSATQHLPAPVTSPAVGSPRRRILVISDQVFYTLSKIISTRARRGTVRNYVPSITVHDTARARRVADLSIPAAFRILNVDPAEEPELSELFNDCVRFASLPAMVHGRPERYAQYVSETLHNHRRQRERIIRGIVRLRNANVSAELATQGSSGV